MVSKKYFTLSSSRDLSLSLQLLLILLRSSTRKLGRFKKSLYLPSPHLLLLLLLLIFSSSSPHLLLIFSSSSPHLLLSSFPPHLHTSSPPHLLTSAPLLVSSLLLYILILMFANRFGIKGTSKFLSLEREKWHLRQKVF